jgi:ATPase subunit of ABC transporter with duplicated ATPase domains
LCRLERRREDAVNALLFNDQQQAPDMIVLDEPTNNLDIQNIEILTAAVNEYKGTLIVVSHDEVFLEETGITRLINV